MKLNVSTNVLQGIVARAMSGASCNKMIPLTNLMSLECKDNILTVTTTDATNYLYLYEELVGTNDDFSVVVGTDIFSKLVAKLTCDTVSLQLSNDTLVVIGNGTYNIELPLDEEGNLIKFPRPLCSVNMQSPTTSFDANIVKLLLSTAKSSLATSLDIPCYTGYYVGDRIVTTDTFKMCGIKEKLVDTPLLLRPEFVDLLSNMTGSSVDVYIDGNSIVCADDKCTVYGKLMENIEDYQIDVISDLLDESSPSYCSVSKIELLQLLDRLSLFVGAYDRGAITFTFTEEGLKITSKQTTGYEMLEYKSSTKFTPFTCTLDIEMLKSLVKANVADIIKFGYGKSNAITLLDSNITQVLALKTE